METGTLQCDLHSISTVDAIVVWVSRATTVVHYWTRFSVSSLKTFVPEDMLVQC